MPIEIKTIKRIFTQDKGSLQFFEANRDIPFGIRRLYYITDVLEGVERGAHAHKTLKQYLFCPYGCIEILFDDGVVKYPVFLDTPDKGIIITPCVWRDMIWHKDNSVLCVAASDYYNADDYIRDYETFLRHTKGN